eukprot:CAMPEP_0181471878 /NCGR_PEP_ID=MMETSP1110-20121109/39304_1 /TAXON_ID=174948 /ORGANISM="Symbiodinium sp., Strain CCMP421" /LENGTH=299 /DNA_ID=CAMNT_0023596915 /DNA_START=47 /DNA_END=947 /DNA_ORIENTATION=+
MAARWLLCFGLVAVDATLRGSNTTRAPEVQAAFHVSYGASPRFCLSSDGNIGDGVKLHLWDCDSSWSSVGQNFHLDEARRLRSTADPAYCVVIDGDKNVNGAKIHLWKCDEANENQRWSVPSQGQIRSKQNSDMCLAVEGNHSFNGAKIQLWSCATVRTEDAFLQGWVKVIRAPSGRGYATPREDHACEAPFVAIEPENCVEAAETMQPRQVCRGSWTEVFFEKEQPAWPLGCMFFGAAVGAAAFDTTGAQPPGIRTRGTACPPLCFASSNEITRRITDVLELLFVQVSLACWSRHMDL